MFRLFRQRIATVLKVLSNKGISGLIKLIKSYFLYQYKEKWEFTYFEKSVVGQPPYKLPKLDDSTVIRIAVKNDITQIKTDIYPFLTAKQENDKRYIEKIGSSHVKCFIAERDKKLVHYSLLYENANNSPLIQTPIINSKIYLTDAYLGSVFTIPEARGSWILRYAILSIFSYLNENTNVQRILVIVHKDTPGAEGFYKGLGFNVMTDATARNYLHIYRSKSNRRN